MKSYVMIRSILVSYFVTSGFTFELTILHTNDVHDRIEQFEPRNGGICKSEKTNCLGTLERTTKDKCFGGVSRRYTKIKEIRANESNVLLLDAGDQFQGTAWFITYEGRAPAYFMNKLGYNVMTFGNHEFDLGVEGLVPFLKNITFPVVCSNIDTSKEPRLDGLYKRSLTLKLGNEIIGFVGYTTPTTSIISKPGPNVKFTDEISALKLEVSKLVKRGVNKIIAIGHSGFPKDKEIAQNVEGIDLVIGGHTDTFLYTGDQPSNEEAVGPYPYVVTQASGAKVLVVQDYTYGKYLGYLNTTWDSRGVITAYNGNPILLNSSVKQDVELEKTVQKWAAPVRKKDCEKIGETRVQLDGARSVCRAGECNMGNMLADAMVFAYMKTYNVMHWAEVGMALVNSGSIRSSIVQGGITRSDLDSVQPFKHKIVLLGLKGRHILDAFEHSVSKYDPLDRSGKFLQVSGFRVVFDMTRPDLQRVASLHVLCTQCTVPRFEPIDRERVYTFITYDYLTNAGNGYTMFRDNRSYFLNYGDEGTYPTVTYIKKFGPVVASIEGRILYRNGTSTPTPNKTESTTKDNTTCDANIVFKPRLVIFVAAVLCVSTSSM